MNDNNENSELENKFAKRLFPVIFFRSIENAVNDEERNKVIYDLTFSPFLDFDLIQEVISLSTSQSINEMHKVDLLLYAKKLSNSFLNERTDKVKNGFSLLYYFNEKVIIEIGHALNEGVTEWITKRTMTNLKNQNKLDHLNGSIEDASNVYILEVELAQKLVDIFDENLLIQTYFGEIDKLYNFIEIFDNKFGKNSFIWLWNTSDKGDWKSVFKFLNN